MDVTSFLDAVNLFMSSARLYVILGLIGLDLTFGVASAIKHGEFDFKKLVCFYQEMVIPYVLAYLGVFVALQYVPDSVGFVADGLDVVTFGAIVVRLASSILENFQELDIKLR